MLSREFTLDGILTIWDFIFSGVEESSFMHKVYEQEDYFFSFIDPLINMDFVCLALVSSVRKELLQKDFIECLKLLLDMPKVDSADSILKIAQRIKKVLVDKRGNKKHILEKNEFPSRIEESIEKYTSSHNSGIHQNQSINSGIEDNLFDQHNKFFKVKEALAEEEDDDAQADITETNKSIVVDEEGDTFIECNTEQNIHEEEEEFHDASESLDETEHNPNHFKLKSTKGCVMYDKRTKTKRYVSPFEQFLNQQQDLFKKGNAQTTDSLPDEQASVTLTTIASTQFDNRTSVSG